MLDILIFLYLFMPQFKIPVYHILFIFSLFYILYNKKTNKEFYNKKILYLNIFYIIIIISLSIVTILFNGKSLLNIRTNFISFVEIPIIAFGITLHLKKNQESFDNLIKKCIISSMCQSLIGILAFFFQNIQKFLLENFVFIKMNTLQKQNLSWIMNKRLYGVSNELTFSTPIYQSLIGVICFNYFKNFKQKRYLLYSLLILFSAFVNARIAILSCIVSIFIILLKTTILQKIKILPYILLLLLIFLLIQDVFKENNTIKWINEAFDEIKNLFLGKKVGTFEILFGKSFLRIPTKEELFLGTGEIIFGKKNGSDIGYINDLWFGGIVYSLILWIFFIHNLIILYYSKLKCKFLEIKNLVIILFLITIIVHIKGTFYSPSSYWNFIVLIISFNLIGRKKWK